MALLSPGVGSRASSSAGSGRAALRQRRAQHGVARPRVLAALRSSGGGPRSPHSAPPPPLGGGTTASSSTGGGSSSSAGSSRPQASVSRATPQPLPAPAAGPLAHPQPPQAQPPQAQPAALSGSSSSSPSSWYPAVGLSALAALICSVDRAAISVAILPMSEQFGWGDAIKGSVNSAFYVGYTLSNLVGGYLASSTSAKQVLGAGVVLWSMFTISTPPAAAVSLPVLYANRAVMGAGEGVTFPCIQSIVRGWVPPDTRTRALTLIYSGGQLGTILALVTAPLLIKAYGWPSVFYIYGSLGIFWNIAWQRFVSSNPPLLAAEQAKLRLSLAQQQQQQQQQQQAQVQQQDAQQQVQQQDAQQQVTASSQAAGGGLPRIRDLPWKRFFTNRAFLAILLAHSAFGVGHYVCLSWLPTYYNQAFGVDVQQSALLSVLPWFVTVLVSNSSGWIADGLANSGTLSMTNTRKVLQTVGSVGPALCLLYLALGHGEDPGDLGMGEAVALLTATLSLGGFQSAGFASNHQDISSRYAAVLFGVTNATSSLMGTGSVFATGLILEATGSWSLVFQLVAAFYLAGAAAYVALASAEQQFE